MSLAPCPSHHHLTLSYSKTLLLVFLNLFFFQSILHPAATVIFSKYKFDQASPLLKTFQYLPIAFAISSNLYPKAHMTRYDLSLAYFLSTSVCPSPDTLSISLSQISAVL